MHNVGVLESGQHLAFLLSFSLSLSNLLSAYINMLKRKEKKTPAGSK